MKANYQTHWHHNVYDALGNKLELIRECDTETGEVTQMIHDANGEILLDSTRTNVVEIKKFYPAPLIIKKISPTFAELMNAKDEGEKISEIDKKDKIILALKDSLRTLENSYEIESDRRQSIRLINQALQAING